MKHDVSNHRRALIVALGVFLLAQPAFGAAWRRTRNADRGR